MRECEMRGLVTWMSKRDVMPRFSNARTVSGRRLKLVSAFFSSSSAAAFRSASAYRRHEDTEQSKACKTGQEQRLERATQRAGGRGRAVSARHKIDVSAENEALSTLSKDRVRGRFSSGSGKPRRSRGRGSTPPESDAPALDLEILGKSTKSMEIQGFW